MPQMQQTISNTQPASPTEGISKTQNLVSMTCTQAWNYIVHLSFAMINCPTVRMRWNSYKAYQRNFKNIYLINTWGTAYSVKHMKKISKSVYTFYTWGLFSHIKCQKGKCVSYIRGYLLIQNTFVKIIKNMFLHIGATVLYKIHQ